MSETWKPGSAVRLETERFTLTSMSRFEAMMRTYAWTFDPELMHPLGYEAGTWSRWSWYRKLKRANNKRKFLLGIRPKGTDDVIGYETFEVTSRGVAFLTVVIGNHAWWGKGVVRETRAAVIDFLFRDVGCARVWAMVSSRNLPAIYNYQVLGAVHEGVMRRHGFDNTRGEFVDFLVFGILREEWLRRNPARAADRQAAP